MGTVARDGAGTITVAPATGPYSALVVLMHGLGDSAEGFADVAEMWHAQMPHAKFVLPTAPTQPVTLNQGFPMPSWYDIVGLEERTNEDCKGIDDSRARVAAILRAEHKDGAGLAYSRMVLAGFSQGGALALYTGLSDGVLPEPIGGVLCLSGYLAGAKTFELAEAARDVPILHCHGTADPMVQFAMAQKTERLLRAKGCNKYFLKPYDGMPHTVTPQEIADCLAFFRQVPHVWTTDRQHGDR